jgi:hypothetical protein
VVRSRSGLLFEGKTERPNRGKDFSARLPGACSQESGHFHGQHPELISAISKTRLATGVSGEPL